MNTLKTVFNKLQDSRKTQLSRKTNLSKKSVKLSIVDNINDLYDSLRDSYDTTSYYANERLEELQDEYFDAVSNIKLEIDEMAINGTPRFLEEEGEKMKALVGELENKAADLGIEPSELIQGYDEIVFMVDNYEALYSDFIRLYRETIKATGNNDFL
jgi:CII-binding regulator of phage lambda lysogenization HflD